MTSLSGTKERSSRSRKCGMSDTSPTKSASFFPETWYRKAYEEPTRSSTRPAPEGAGSMPSSTGTPSPGSGISSPGSFSGSPGTTSPGIGTGSPGSLGGSPGFGTGSPASGSGSSPGSERVIWCENCNARLTELKRQALKLLIPGPYSSKDPSFSLLLHDKLQVPNSSRRAWNERDSRCDVCATHLTQLKQEAISQMITEASREGVSEAALNRYNTHSPAHTNSPSHTSSACNTSAVTTTALTSTSAAASFFARAAQKLNLASKKKKQKTLTVSAPVASSPLSCDLPLFPTTFSSALLKSPPPAPPCLLRAANKIKDNPGLGKVKVMVRVCPVSRSDAAESSSFLKVDARKKQITIMDPSANQTPSAASQKKAGANQVPPKMFTFDAAFPPDASQAEVCAGTVAEVIQSVVNGADGCVFCFGHSKLGKSYTMIGRDDSLQTLGIIPCAISWLFKLINERKEKTGARFSVRDGEVEVWGKDENLKDLLSEMATGSLQDGQSPGVYLCEDPICGMQLQNQSELRAPTPEKAAWFLDAAIAARHSSQRPNTTEEEHRNSHMLFTLHLYQEFSETLSTIQIASRVLRMKKKKTKVTVQYTSSSSGGESSCEEGRMRRPTHLRPFHHRGDTDSDLPLLRLSSDPDEYSSTVLDTGTKIAAAASKKRSNDQQLQEIKERSKVYTQKGVMPATPPLSSHTLAQDIQTSDNSLAADSGRSSTESLLSRTSPAGMSPQVRETTPPLSASLGSAETLCDDDVPPIPLDTHKDESVGASGPVLLGKEELAYTITPSGEEDLVVTALIEAHSVAGRPTSIISFNSDCGSEAALASDSQPINIICGTDSDGPVENSPIAAGLTTASEVVAMAEVAMAKLRTGEPLAIGMSNSGSTISSWMSDLSAASEADQSLNSFSQSQSQQGEALADPESSFGLDGLSSCESEKSSRRGNLEGELVLSENTSDKGTANKDRLRKLPPSMAKTTIQILAGPGNHSPFKSTKNVHPCVAVKPMVIHEPTILPSPTKTQFMKDPIKPKSEILASISSEMSFEDPWLKRELEEGMSWDLVCEVKPEVREGHPLKSPPGEKGTGENGDHHGFCRNGGDYCSSGLSKEVVSSPGSFKRVVDGCEMVAVVAQGECLTGIYSPDIHRTGSLPRGWHRLNLHDGLDCGIEYHNLGVTTSTPCSPRATLDRSSGKLGFFSHRKGGIPPLPPVRKSSLDQRNRAASPLHNLSHGASSVSGTADNAGASGCAPAGISRQRGSSIDSSRLFSAKLEQLANRTNSLGRAHGLHGGSYHYDCFSLERGESLRGGGGARGDTTMPRTGRSLTRAGSVSSPTGNSSSTNFSGSTSPSSAPQSPAKTSSQIKISAVSKLLMTSSPKARSLSASSTKTLSFSTKSLNQTANRSSSLPPNGKGSAQSPVQQQGPATSSWSTQSLSRSRGGSLTAKLPLRAVNSRISELLQGSTGSRSRSHVQGGGTDRAEEKDAAGSSGGGAGGDSLGEEKAAVVQTLPSPYSKITAPRKAHRCSSGHASDNSSVLSGELPPAMGKTALFYHSGGSSGYESMLRDSSENTGSTSSAQDSLSEHSSATTSSRRSSKSSKKSRSNTGLQRRRLIPALTLDSSSTSPSQRSSKQAITSSSSSSSSPGACWVDGPLGPPASSNHRGAATTETFEIKVYEIDDVERLQKRRGKGGKEVVYVSAKLRLLEHRQQRISEVRAKYQCLKKELEQTKQHLMLEPHKWTTEFELQQPYDVDSVEYLEALETVTDKLETRVNFCKAHLMMITCFDVSSRHR
uniref:Kinesin family member 26B n=2 Tax=Nothobranchius rachovii TaxID=451742 RepID=A0A1A8P5B7_9TELE